VTGRGAAWASLVAGLAAVAILPLAIYATRYTNAYDLLDAAFAIPVALALGLVSLAIGRRARRLDALRLGLARSRLVRAGRILGILGVCMAASGVVSLAVYGLLEYVGSRD
jgi:malonyl CoA-acyl carrier protein transacylase